MSGSRKSRVSAIFSSELLRHKRRSLTELTCQFEQRFQNLGHRLPLQLSRSTKWRPRQNQWFQPFNQSLFSNKPTLVKRIPWDGNTLHVVFLKNNPVLININQFASCLRITYRNILSNKLHFQANPIFQRIP